ncbi:MAG: FemAB family XrtA/PEP-CTERM system-associated protein [Nitrospinota bacterium]
MSIRLASEEDRDVWNGFVDKHPYATPYHDFSWRELLEETYGHKCFYLLAEREGRVSGVLPMILVKPPFLGGTLVSLPFCDIGGALALDDDVKSSLVLEAVDVAKGLNVHKVELREDTPPEYLQKHALTVGTRTHKVRMILTLPETSELLWSSFKAKLRSQVRKAEKNGLRFSWGERVEDTDAFYSVFSTNMKELGSPVHAKSLFQALYRKYKNARFGLVYFENTPVGAGVILFTGSRVSIPWASTLLEYNRLSPNMLMYWNFLKFSCESGFETFDFGRSSPGEGTYRFKEQWGARPQPLCWNMVHLAGKPDESSSVDSGKKKIVIRAWKALPLQAANLLGPILRKYISL